MCSCAARGIRCWHHEILIGGTRAGKLTMMRLFAEEMQFRRDHPNGVVRGEVIESRPTPQAELPAGSA